MFGHQNDQDQQQDQQQANPGLAPQAGNDSNFTQPAPQSDYQAPQPQFVPPSDQQPFSPPAPDQNNGGFINQDQNNFTPSAPAIPAVDPAAPDSAAAPDGSGVHTNDLLDIKQQALSQLSPLVGHLDQTPEEKFRTTMMMIQASDDQSLIKDAYEAAQSIDDEKTKAQALLDVINEINYFTQHAAN